MGVVQLMPFPASVPSYSIDFADVAYQIDGTGAGTRAWAASDLKGGAANGSSQINAPSFVSDDLEFNGSTSRLQWSDSDWWHPKATGMTWEWFGLQADTISASGGITNTLQAQETGTTNRSFWTYLYDGNLQMWYTPDGTSGSIAFFPNIPITAGELVSHAMWTWDGSAVRAYKNGAYVGKVTGITAIYNSSAVMEMGRHTTTHYFDGRFRAMRVSRVCAITDETSYTADTLPLPTS